MAHGDPGEPGADVACTEHVWTSYSWLSWDGTDNRVLGSKESYVIKELCAGCDAWRTREVKFDRAGEVERRGYGLTDLEYRLADALLDMAFLHFGYWPLEGVDLEIPYVRTTLVPLLEHLDVCYEMRLAKGAKL